MYNQKYNIKHNLSQITIITLSTLNLGHMIQMTLKYIYNSHNTSHEHYIHHITYHINCFIT